MNSRKEADFRIGIIGAGHIAQVMADTINKTKGIVCEAIASRNVDKARDFAIKNKIHKYYGSYLELVRDNDIDMVYIATVNSAHKKNALLCIQHGKPVLLEKPVCLNANDTEEILRCAAEHNVFVAEAMIIRYMDTAKFLREVLQKGVIGDIRLLYSNISMDMPDVERIRSKELGGGALYDIGVYSLHLARMIFGDANAITRTVASMNNGIDLQHTIAISYDKGQEAVLFNSVSWHGDGQAVIYGSNGKIVIDKSFNIQSVKVYKGRRLVLYKKCRKTGYMQELLACKNAIIQGKIETDELPHREILFVSKWMDEIRNMWKKEEKFLQ